MSVAINDRAHFDEQEAQSQCYSQEPAICQFANGGVLACHSRIETHCTPTQRQKRLEVGGEKAAAINDTVPRHPGAVHIPVPQRVLLGNQHPQYMITTFNLR